MSSDLSEKSTTLINKISDQLFRSQMRSLLNVLGILIILTLLWILFFWRIITPQADDRMIFDQDGDFVLHFYAPIAYQVERFWDGDIGQWNPYNYAGEPLAANIQNGTFYPLHYITALLAGEGNYSVEAYQIETAAHYWLASVLMFLFLIVIFRQPMIAIVGSILFAYSGYMTGYPMLQASTVATEMWLPLALLGVHLSITRQKWSIWGTIIAAVSVALMLLAGRPQAAFYNVCFVMLYLMFIAWLEKRTVRDVFWRAIFVGGFGATLAAIQLLPAKEFYDYSFRLNDKDYFDKAMGFTPSELIRLILPGFNGAWSPLYIGGAGFILAIGALLRRKRHTFLWIVVFLGGIFFALGINSIAFDFFYIFIPGFNLFRNQERIASLIVFALVMLACYQLQWLFRQNNDDPNQSQHVKRFTHLLYAYSAFLGIVFACATLVQTLKLSEDVSEAANVFGFIALVGGSFALWFAWSRDHSQKPIVVLSTLLCIIVIDLFTVGTRSINFERDIPENRIQLHSVLEPYQTSDQDIEWRIDGASGLEGRGTYFHIPDIYGLGPLHLETIESLVKIPVDRFWEVLSVRYATVFEEPPTETPLELLAYDTNYSGQEYKLFELQDPRPMAHLVYDYISADDNPIFARQIMSDPRVDLRETAVLLQNLQLDLPSERPTISIVEDFQMHEPEHIEMTVSTETDAILTLSVINYPGWHASINGRAVDTVDNYAGLIAIPIRAGMDQQVTFKFDSESLQQGKLISIISLMTLIMIGLTTLFLQSKARKYVPLFRK